MVSSVKELVENLFVESLRKTLPDEVDVVPMVAACLNQARGPFQCNNAMSFSQKLKEGKMPGFSNTRAVGQAIMENLPASDMVDKCSVAGPGFHRYRMPADQYTFGFNLDEKGHAAVFCLHARICLIIRKSGKDIENLNKVGTIALDHPAEQILGFHLLQFSEAVQGACMKMLPKILREYLYHVLQEL
ncbi:OLC1v1032990C1 [Oldenlandia corymbosa var. corymbosa]|uniref:arginine--tRNA ligase n=1 Tax=Oldenlandia corymbosa var. corymbosa TaxID=529605 RepID=A0AAV1CQJ3_OLDCO|nr:OLC1v1032990C1 [Oldenlandia corymbosa var. corymbosa]